MSYNVQCSYGEIVDKLTILEIKLSKSNDDLKSKHVMDEYNTIKHLKQSGFQFNELYEELKNINKILWECEDKIRIKSKLKEFDREYISISEQIHKKNDCRHNLKRSISIMYQSYIVEEKIYKIIV
jgi:hypothetical protein